MKDCGCAFVKAKYFAEKDAREKGKDDLRSLVFSTTLTLLLASTVASFSSFSPACAQQRTWTVDVLGQADFDTIQEAINNAADGDTVFVNAGAYYEHVVINKTLSLLGEDVRTTIIDGNSTGHVINIMSDRVNVTGFTVQKSGSVHMPALEAGICLNNSADCVVSGNYLVDNGFCGISLLYSQRNIIIDNNISRSSWGGIHLLTSSHNIVSRNIVDNTYGGINGHASSHNNNFTENAISNSTYGMFYNNANYNNICGNNISAIEVAGIWLQEQVSYNNVTENNLINNTVAIRVQGPNRNNTLSRNFITGAEYGLKLENTQYTSITDNTIVNNRAGNDSWRAGMRLEGGGYSQINSNLISGNYYGILLYTGSPSVSVYGNNITDNEFGLRVASGGSNYLKMSDNIVMNNRGYGIGLTGFGSASNYATITRNLIVNNSDGIALGQYSNYNTISYNNMSENECGIYIESSTQNTLYGNNMLSNTQQVNVTFGSINVCDGGYPSGGNYWSDYNGADSFSGVYQNVSGSDGIGDVPYIIDANNIDSYPLINPWIPQALSTDINDDGIVNIVDITIVAKAFGCRPSDPNWTQAADLNNDEIINIIDITLVAKDYGKTI